MVCLRLVAQRNFCSYVNSKILKKFRGFAHRENRLYYLLPACFSLISEQCEYWGASFSASARDEDRCAMKTNDNVYFNGMLEDASARAPVFYLYFHSRYICHEESLFPPHSNRWS